MAGYCEMGRGGASVEQATARPETSVLLGGHGNCEGDVASGGETGGGRASTTWVRGAR